MHHHPRPWWFRLALLLAPDRCREIPEATDPTGKTILLRQVALVKRYLYLQQFASSENPNWMHSHQWRRTVALGLWGSYTERRHGVSRRKWAPYLYTMGPDVVHQVVDPSRGHTSLFLGVWRRDELKHYFWVREGNPPTLIGQPWDEHVKVMVARI